MKVLLNALYKGGISKTTQSVILTHVLAERGYQVLFIDFDPQMSGTRFLSTRGIEDPLFQQKNIFEAVKHDDLGANIIPLQPNIDYVAGNEFINLFETLMDQKKILQDKRFLYIQMLLASLHQAKAYDFVIMDMSPTKSILNHAVMGATTHHIITSQSEVLSIEIIKRYMDDVQELQLHGVPSEVLGISLGMRDRTNLSKQAIHSVQQHFGNLVFDTVTKRHSKISEYAATGYPVKNNRGMYNVRDRQALQLHWQLADEILHRLELPLKKEEITND